MKKSSLFCFSILLIFSVGCKKDSIPVLSTAEISDITSTKAISGGTITDEGSSQLLSRGVCWSISGKPTINDSKTVDSIGTGSFISLITGLSGNTKYYVRAYAVNGHGTGYGMEIQFTTLSSTLPDITTKTPIVHFYDGIYRNSISTGGDIFSDGGSVITSRGVCWSTINKSPTISDDKTIDGLGVGSFLSKIDGFLRETNYYVRAYATNSFGTAYGNTVSVLTPCHINMLKSYYLSLSLPGIGATGQPLNNLLKWSCSGEGDMRYNVYLDTIPDPVKIIASEISTDSLALSGLDSATTYYWKIYAWNPLIPCDNYTATRHFTTVGLPKVTTSDVTENTFTNAIVRGNIVNDGGATVTEYGVFWGTSKYPESTGSKLPIGSGTGPFSINLSGLNPNTTYYVKAYAININGTSYGSQVSFNTGQNTYLPKITTSPIIIYTSTYSVVGGYVISEGSYPVIENGIYWGISQNPELTGTKLQIGSGGGLFSTTLTGLNPATIYYLKAYATNQEGTVYGSQVTFYTGESSSIQSVSDIEGNVYHTVKIGSQTWMVENLKTTKYADGTPISLVNTRDSWYQLKETTRAYCWYNDDISNRDTYGALYTWAAVMNRAESSNNNPSGVKGVCPTGWHLPSKAEWIELVTFLGGDSIAGGKMKEAGIVHWDEPNYGATNESGFSGLPGGARGWHYGFGQIGKQGIWWSSTESEYVFNWTEYVFNDGYAWKVILRDYLPRIDYSYDYKQLGHSVRCVKDY